MAESSSAKSKPKSRSTRARLEKKLSELVLEAVATEEFGRSASVASKVRTKVQRMVAEEMSGTLGFFNMPSREDIVALGERLTTIDNRLVRIEEMLLDIHGAGSGASSSRKKVARTRVAPGRKAAPEKKSTTRKSHPG